MIAHKNDNFTPSFWLEMILYGRKKVLHNVKTALSIKNRSNVCKKPDVMGTNGYPFWIQREKLVQKHLHIKRHKGSKNL